MSYEWHPEFALGFSNRQDLKDVVEGRGKFAPVQDLYARLQLLAQSVEESKWNTDAKALSKREPRPLSGKVEIPYTYQRLTLRYHDRKKRTVYTDYIRRQMKGYADLGFVTPALTKDDLARLPPFSFFLYVPFTLASPYLSKDDEPFYVHENPVRKEHVLRVPLMSGTSWKGAFRAALRYRLEAGDDDPRIIRLLGSQKGVEKGFRRGRLSFFPTFFDALEVEVINPHSRETCAGTQPIHIEAVPPGAHGVFALLYLPVITGHAAGPLPEWDEVVDDLSLVGQAAYTLLAELGFGAKTHSGMGRAGGGIPGAYLLLWITVQKPLPPPPSPQPPPKTFVPDDDRFLDDNGQWPLYETKAEINAHIQGKKARSRYKRQRMAYYAWKELCRRWEAWENEVTAQQGRIERRMVKVRCNQLADLEELRQRVEERVKGGPR